MAVITLTTDFGTSDNFVGVMKGVVLSIDPSARIVDLTHDLPRHDVTGAAFSLFCAYRYFPPGTIHVAVVDPGVGSNREIAAVKASGHVFIAPDNGLLSYILDEAPNHEARLVRNFALALESVSRTFHGRDIMAPAAAHLSRGVPFEKLGPSAAKLFRLPPLNAEISPNEIKGRVIHVDHFGNLITNILAAQVMSRPIITMGTLTITGLSDSYSAVEPGAYLALAGSSGFLEIARNMGRAEKQPGLTVGSPVLVRHRP